MWPGLLIGALILIAFLFIVKNKSPKIQNENSSKSDEYQFGLDQEDAEDIKKNGLMLRCDIHDEADIINGWRTLEIIKTTEDYFLAISPSDKTNTKDTPTRIDYDSVFEWKAINK